MERLRVTIIAFFTLLLFCNINDANTLLKDKTLEFNSSSDIVSFNPGSVYLVSANHMLKIKFKQANSVQPYSKGLKSTESGLLKNKILYDNLWAGVSLVYEKSNTGIVKSTFIVEPKADVNSIDLEYNKTVEITKQGELRFNFNSGVLTQSKPLAWQIINGKKNFVTAKFKKKGEKEIGFTVGNYNRNFELIIDPTWQWNTFVGCSSDDQVKGITVDDSGNVYAVGFSWCTWGNPVNPHSGNRDAFVVKLNNNGERVWNTFLGSASVDIGEGIDLSDSTVVIAGYSDATWGTPVNPFATSGENAFAAKLNCNDGTLIWNTFMGSDNTNYGSHIAAGPMGTIYVVGTSFTPWGYPIDPFIGGQDAFLVQLDSEGNLMWSTFMGSEQTDYAYDVALDDALNAYVIGYSTATWGEPVHAYNGGTSDAFVAKFAYNGIRIWHTFLGASDEDDRGYGIDVDSTFNVYVIGESEATWGSPINPFAGDAAAFVAKLNEEGALQWNTFLGGTSIDYGYGIMLDASNNIFLSGSSLGEWGNPVDPFNGSDAFVAQLDSRGNLIANTFLGGTSVDVGYSVFVNESDEIYVGGYSQSTWGTPVSSYTGRQDGFVAKLTFPPVSVEANEALPNKFQLSQNYPNPFPANGGTGNQTTIIKYSIPASLVETQNIASLPIVTLKVYDILGQKISTLVNKVQTPGNYSVHFNASNLPAGIYFYRLQAGNFTATKKMIVLK